MECRRPYDITFWAVYFAQFPAMGFGKFTKTDAPKIVLMDTPNNQPTFVEFVEMVKQMRHNQRRYANNPKPEINETRLKYEKEVDTVVAKLTDTQTKLPL